MDPELKYTLITGGSLGIGKALARECAGRGMNLLLVAKDQAELEDAAKELQAEFSVEVHILQIDLREADAPQKVLDWCKQKGYRVDILMNNAGVAGTSAFGTSPPEYSDERILVNIRALVLLTRLFLPELRTHSRAYILNTGSLSAYYPIAYKSVYAASKAFVLSFSRALREELRGSRISVTVVNPNGVRTNDDAHDRIDKHSWFAKRFLIHETGKIARISVDRMLKGRLVVVPGIFNRILILVSRMLPAGFRDRQTSRIIRKELSE